MKSTVRGDGCVIMRGGIKCTKIIDGFGVVHINKKGVDWVCKFIVIKITICRVR